MIIVKSNTVFVQMKAVLILWSLKLPLVINEINTHKFGTIFFEVQAYP